MFDKVDQLKTVIATNRWDNTHTEQYQKLDDIVTASMLSAERQTGKSFSTHYDWSPILKKADLAQRYWNLRLKQHRGGTVSQTRLEYYRINSDLPQGDTKTEAQII